jgi:hypothetical protein
MVIDNYTTITDELSDTMSRVYSTLRLYSPIAKTNALIDLKRELSFNLEVVGAMESLLGFTPNGIGRDRFDLDDDDFDEEEF